MKHFGFYYFLTVGLVYLALFGWPSFPQAAPLKAKVYAAHPTKEQRASHMIRFYDQDSKQLGLCTSTAIGPHAFLTAEHCTELYPGAKKAVFVRFDLATEKHDLVAVAYDGRDHAIWLVAGTPFTNIENVKTAETVVGENLFFYGSGKGMYPPVPRKGKALSCDDPSDLDRSAHIFCFTMDTLHGDSGSAIYNSKGELVGVITYLTDDGGSGFSLNFSPEEIKTAVEFDGTFAVPDINSLIQQMLGAPQKE